MSPGRVSGNFSAIPSWPREAAAAAAVAVLLGAACWPALRAPVVDNDSFAVVYARPDLGRRDGLADLFSPAYFTRYGIGGWRPLSTAAYSVVYRIGEIDPFSYKLFKLALHALSSMLVFGIGALLLGDRRWALAGAAAYFLRLSQPAFDGLAFFPDALAAFFSLAAAYSHLRGRAFLTAGLYACALLSKESALALPALLLLCELCLPGVRGGGWKRTWAALWPLLIVASSYLGFSKWHIVVENFYGPAEWTPRGPAGRILLAYRDYWREFFDGDAALAVGGLGLLWAAADRATRAAAARWTALAAGWTLLSLWSVLNVWPFFPRFESYLLLTESRHLALPGAAMAWLFGFWGSSCGRRRAAGWAAGLLAAWWLAASARSDFLRRADWAGRLTAGLQSGAEPFAAGAAKRPLYETPFSQALLSLPLIRRGAPGPAAEIEEALRRRLAPEDARETLAFFGDESLYREVWKAKLALQLMNRESLPDFLSLLAAEAAYRRGKDALARGRPEEALAAFRAALARDPEHEASCLGLAAAHQAGGRESRAAARLASCRTSGLAAEDLASDGGARASVHQAARELSRALAGMRLADALGHFDNLRDAMGPLWRVDLLLSGAAASTRRKDYPQAEQAYARVLREAPSAWPGRKSVEAELQRLRRGSRTAFDSAMKAFAGGDDGKAIEGFGEALRLSPDFVEAYLSRGALLAGQGRWEEALKDYDEGLRQPDASRNKVLLEYLRTARADALRRARQRQ